MELIGLKKIVKFFSSRTVHSTHDAILGGNFMQFHDNEKSVKLNVEKTRSGLSVVN